MSDRSGPLVSVVIPTFNRCRLLCEAIDSILRQNYPHLEIIVVDDGSTDDTAQILAARYGGRLHYIRQDNRGFGAARNRGVAAAAGTYIAFLDSDDVWLEGKLALQVAVMERLPEVVYTFTDFIIFNDTGRYDHNGLQSWFGVPQDWELLLPKRIRLAVEQVIGSGRTEGVDVYLGDLYRPLLSQCYVLPSTAMVRATAIGPDVKHTEGDPYCADWDFFALLSRDQTIGYLDVETALNRSHDDAVRLTRSMDAAEKVGYRLASLERIWKADTTFAQRYGDELARVESGLLLQQAKAWFLGGRTDDAKRALAAYRRCSVRVRQRLALALSVLLAMPYSASAVRALLTLRR